MDPFLTEWNKMVTGKRYRAAMPRFQEDLRKAQLIVRRFNDMSPDDVDGRMALLRGFFAKCGERVQINQPMRCDWGCNISIGHDTFINFNLTILDEAPVTIGNHVFIGPNVSIFTACHPLDAEEPRDFFDLAGILLQRGFVFSLKFRMLLFKAFMFLAQLFVLFQSKGNNRFFHCTSTFYYVAKLSK